MGKRKICVYAICKDEEKFIERWYNSVKEADAIYVLDTGSKDKSVKKLKSLGVNVVKKIIKPWRFDVARNEALKLVPEDTDICVSMDIDEVIEPGWREKLEEVWKDDTTRLQYNYNWAFDENGKPTVNFYIEKIHSRNNYKWTHPVHEVLTSSVPEKKIVTNEITVNHYPDSSKSRSSYLELLELSVKEEPNDDRNTHYLAREYMYNRRWNDAINMFHKHLSLESATWKDERAASMRFLSRCYLNLGWYEESRLWAELAIKEAPHLRDGLMERAMLAYKLNKWEDVNKYVLRALDIKTHPKTYINEIFSWDYTPYDLLSLSSFYLGHYNEALYYVNLALELNPNDKRLLANKELFIAKINN